MKYRVPAWQTIVLTAVFAALVSLLLAFARPVEMRVDGQTLQSEVSPVTTVQDKVYVPIRPLAAALGANVVEIKDDVIISRGTQTLHIKVGDTQATFNGAPLILKHAPFRVQGHVMMGMKAFGRAFGVSVSYNRQTARIDVRTGTTDTSAAVDNSAE